MSLRNLKIRTQLGLIAGVVLLGYLIVAGFYGYGMVEQKAFDAARKAADRASSLAATVNYQFLDTRRHEKDFLARKDDKYVKAVGIPPPRSARAWTRSGRCRFLPTKSTL